MNQNCENKRYFLDRAVDDVKGGVYGIFIGMISIAGVILSISALMFLIKKIF